MIQKVSGVFLTIVAALKNFVFNRNKVFTLSFAILRKWNEQIIFPYLNPNLCKCHQKSKPTVSVVYILLPKRFQLYKRLSQFIPNKHFTAKCDKSIKVIKKISECILNVIQINLFQYLLQVSAIFKTNGYLSSMSVNLVFLLSHDQTTLEESASSGKMGQEK